VLFDQPTFLSVTLRILNENTLEIPAQLSVIGKLKKLRMGCHKHVDLHLASRLWVRSFYNFDVKGSLEAENAAVNNFVQLGQTNQSFPVVLESSVVDVTHSRGSDHFEESLVSLHEV
jgi:hypothetical protein